MNISNPENPTTKSGGKQARNLSYEEALTYFDEEAQIVASELGLEGSANWYFCDRYVESKMKDWYCDEPLMEGTYDGITYLIFWLGGAPHLMVLDSPLTQKFELCSPCVPNACDGGNPDEDGHEGYDVPEDWIRKEV